MPRVRTIAELRRELVARETEIKRLQAKRSKLARRLAGIDREIVALGGEVTSAGAVVGRGRGGKRRAGRRRRATGKPLAEYIKSILAKAKEGMRARDVMKAVKKAGYPTYSKSFYGIVAAALQDAKDFRRVSRGIYALRGRKATARKPKRKPVKVVAKKAVVVKAQEAIPATGKAGAKGKGQGKAEKKPT